jgi:hypothetical protein
LLLLLLLLLLLGCSVSSLDSDYHLGMSMYKIV